MVAPQSDEAKLREYMRNEVPLALAESLKHYDIDSDDWKQVCIVLSTIYYSISLDF